MNSSANDDSQNVSGYGQNNTSYLEYDPAKNGNVNMSQAEGGGNNISASLHSSQHQTRIIYAG